LLGYLQHIRPKAEKMLPGLATVTRFVPLLTNLYRFLEGQEITGLNMVPIPATLHTFFMSLLPGPIAPENVFQYAVKLASYVSLVDRRQFLKFHSSNWTDATRTESYCKRTG
jgi:hypothetical protein